MTTRKHPTLEDIIQLATDIEKDHNKTRATLALLRNGHPGSPIPQTDHQTPPHPDPTGEWATTPDHAVRHGRTYEKLLHRAHTALKAADLIRRQMLPIDITHTKTADPEQWCKNCIDHGHCAPRTADRGLYCSWCRTIQQVWGFLPPKHVVDLWHAGNKAPIQAALQAHKKRRG